jgi:hypothetical protein
MLRLVLMLCFCNGVVMVAAPFRVRGFDLEGKMLGGLDGWFYWCTFH